MGASNILAKVQQPKDGGKNNCRSIEYQLEKVQQPKEGEKQDCKMIIKFADKPVEECKWKKQHRVSVSPRQKYKHL